MCVAMKFGLFWPIFQCFRWILLEKIRLEMTIFGKKWFFQRYIRSSGVTESLFLVQKKWFPRNRIFIPRFYGSTLKNSIFSAKRSFIQSNAFCIRAIFGEMTGQKISIVGCNKIWKSLKRWEKLLIFFKWTYNMAYSD